MVIYDQKRETYFVEPLRRDIMAAMPTIPDFPKPGILFRDIRPVVRNVGIYRRVIRWMVEEAQDLERENGRRFDAVLPIELRGYLFGPVVAYELNLPLAVSRKPGKLPPPVIGVSYEKEYGSDRLEIGPDDITPNQNILVIDDVLATGETRAGVKKLIQERDAMLGASIMAVELAYCGARQKLNGDKVRTLVVFE